MKGRERTNTVGDRQYTEKMQRKKKIPRGGIRAKRGRGSRREQSERKRDKSMSRKDRKEGEQVRGEKRGGDVTFRLSGVCFECMCGTQRGLKASSTPLNLHSQSSFFIPLITWLSSDQSTASLA